jgi:CBS domain-containing protein
MTLRVSDIMTTALVTGAPRDRVDTKLLDMKMASIRHLLVVDEKNKLVGVVSDRDVLMNLGTAKDKTLYLKDIMTKIVETVHQNDDAAEALGVMLDKKIGSLPVVGSHGQLVGVVTETDFLQIAHSMLTRPFANDEEVGL